MNLAICDLLKATLNIPFVSTSSFNQKWIFNDLSKIVIIFNIYMYLTFNHNY